MNQIGNPFIQSSMFSYMLLLSYLSSDDDVKDDHVYSDEDIKAGKERAVGLKEEGNAYFSQGICYIHITTDDINDHH